MGTVPQVTGDLHLEGLVKRFGGFVAVDHLDLRIEQGSFFALLGPSGCGKTTTLRMVAGLEEPTEGTIRLGDLDITGTKPYRRPVNTVFQSYALFPHLDVHENIAFGLRRRGAKDVDAQVREVLELVQLGPLARRKPHQLSGGQQQRIALARAVVNRPSVLLLDEPLGALDLKLRRQMQLELKRIQAEVGLTFVHVTHDQEEAMTMADTVAVMNHGRIEQLGAPVELYESPRTTFVANFLGQSNLVAGRRCGREPGWVVVDCHGVRLGVPETRTSASGQELLVGVRPEKLHLVPAHQRPGTGLNQIPGAVVTDVSFLGVSIQYEVRLPWGQRVTVFEQNRGAGHASTVGAAVTVAWDPAFSFGLDGDAGAGREADALLGVG